MKEPSKIKCINDKHLKRELTKGKEYLWNGFSDGGKIVVVSDYGQPIIVDESRFEINEK